MFNRKLAGESFIVAGFDAPTVLAFLLAATAAFICCA
jgi:hypothetical protein